MTDAFHSARLTFDRAQHHIREFNASLAEFTSDQRWTYFIDHEPDRDVHKIKFTQDLPEGLPCVLFDIANNLRAVLDQAGYASAIVSGKVNPKRTSFPFGGDPAGLDNNVNGREVSKDCPPEITTLFLTFCPYKGGNDALWALNKLCNTKKHCALVPLQISNAVANFSAIVPDGGTVGNAIDSQGNIRGWNAAKHQMTLVSVPPGTNPHIPGNFTFSIAIDGIETLSDKPAIGVIDTMCGVVKCVLLATEAECRRLSFIA